jgi:hypothetical protein
LLYYTLISRNAVAAMQALLAHVYQLTARVGLLQVPNLSDMLQLDEVTCAELVQTVFQKVRLARGSCVAQLMINMA